MKDNIKSLIDNGGLCTHGGVSDRRAFAVVTGCHIATVVADLKRGKDINLKVGVEAPNMPELGLEIDAAQSASLKIIGSGVIGIRMLCFKMKKNQAVASGWQVSKRIPVCSGRFPIDLKDTIIWTCQPLRKRLVMWTNPGRFSFVVMCPDIVLKITSIDEATRSEIERLMSAACDDDATEHVSIAEEKHFSAVSDEKETDGGAQRIRGGGDSAASTVKNSDYDPISSFFEKQGFDWQQFWNTVWYFCQQNPRYSMNLCSLASFSGTRKQLG